MSEANQNHTADLRQQVEEMIAAGKWSQSLQALAELWRRQPTSATANFVLSCGSTLRERLAMPACRIRILRSFTLEPAVPMVRAAALLAGVDATVTLCDFNAYAQEILDPASALYSEPADLIILAVSTRDIGPALWEGFADLTEEEIGAQAENVTLMFRQWIGLIRGRTSSSLIVHNLETPPVLANGVLDHQQVGSQAGVIARINANLREIAAAHNSVYVLDYDGLVARRGRDNWYDESKWQSVRMPMRADNLPFLAAEWMRFVHPVAGRTAKVVVTDLDNTLWGGVIAEDGVRGIRIDQSYTGVGYWNLQRALLDLQRRGVLLAIASKNNPEDALQAIDEHPEMLLRRKDFAAVRIGWNSKAQSLREIAAELNVGLDSLVFVDDNPVERQQVRLETPEVTVIEMPADPMGYAAAVRKCALFERLVVSAEDRERTRIYATQNSRQVLQSSAGSVEEFYFSLQQQVEVSPLSSHTITRAAQLAQKTNQFNLTTKRYNEEQLKEIASRPDWEVLTVRVSDRFGDNGLVGVCILCNRGGACVIDSMLMSCRVIGRTVETAVLSLIVEEAKARGDERIEGWFLRTKKNAPAAAFYSDHGFVLREETEYGGLWSLALIEGAAISCPPWITLTLRREPVLA